MTNLQAAFSKKFPHADAIDVEPRRVTVRQSGKRAAVWVSTDGVRWTSDAPPEVFVVRG